MIGLLSLLEQLALQIKALSIPDSGYLLRNSERTGRYFSMLSVSVAGMLHAVRHTTVIDRQLNSPESHQRQNALV
jgi:hypothetical protein